MPMYMVCCTKVLLSEIEELKMNQRDVAITFAAALKSEAAGVDIVDWEAVAAAALQRWSPAGWKKLKEIGWRIHQTGKTGGGL